MTKTRPRDQQETFRKGGGKKGGSGRKPKGTRAGSPHKVRPELEARFPVHVVLRVVPAIEPPSHRAAGASSPDTVVLGRDLEISR